MKVILAKPGWDPEVTEIDNTLEAIQEAVGGYFECLPTSIDRVTILCNEEGKLRGLPPCRIIMNCLGGLDLIVGNFLIVGVDGEEFCSLTAPQIAYFMDQADSTIWEV